MDAAAAEGVWASVIECCCFLLLFLIVASGWLGWYLRFRNGGTSRPRWLLCRFQ